MAKVHRADVELLNAAHVGSKQLILIEGVSLWSLVHFSFLLLTSNLIEKYVVFIFRKVNAHQNRTLDETIRISKLLSQLIYQ